MRPGPAFLGPHTDDGIVYRTTCWEIVAELDPTSRQIVEELA